MPLWVGVAERLAGRRRGCRLPGAVPASAAGAAGAARAAGACGAAAAGAGAAAVRAAGDDVLLSRLTAPLRASSRPSTVAAVFGVID